MSLTHINAAGEAHMVDIAAKASTARKAIASGHIRMQPTTLELIRSGNAKKGDVLGAARIAGIMAAKRTAELIPLCHPILLTKVDVHFDYTTHGVRCTATVACQGQTGVEMEALTATSVALLTIYDMCKAAEKGMVIESITLQEKTGGKSDYLAKD